MAGKFRSDSDAARNKRGTLSVKTKRKQPFVLESFLSHADGGRTKAKYRKNETIMSVHLMQPVSAPPRRS
jgi:hypothetical protein